MPASMKREPMPKRPAPKRVIKKITKAPEPAKFTKKITMAPKPQPQRFIKEFIDGTKVPPVAKRIIDETNPAPKRGKAIAKPGMKVMPYRPGRSDMPMNEKIKPMPGRRVPKGRMQKPMPAVKRIPMYYRSGS